MRGKLFLNTLNSFKNRLIPAHAGKTRSAPSSKFHAGAHPRACGENTYTAIQDALTVGSSPRMRGKHFQQIAGFFGGRLIPAHAGKTYNHKRETLRKRAHPRACGENSRQ